LYEERRKPGAGELIRRPTQKRVRLTERAADGTALSINRKIF
jgi:hypothetical protein